MGYLSELQKQTKSTIYLPHTPVINISLLNKISLDRNEFGRYFRLIQFACENNITGYYTHHLFNNILKKIKDNNYSYIQFFICLQIFKELGIIVTDEQDSQILEITDVKSPLNASATYNRLNLLKVNN